MLRIPLNIVRPLMALVLIAWLSAPAGAYVTGPVFNPANGHAYYLVLGNWNEMETEAVILGGHLATINDAAENAWVNTNVIAGYSATTPVFIGLSDAAVEGTFRWIDGSPVTYTNWNAGEPNGFSSSEDYVQVLPSGFWNDAPINGAVLGVVEVPLPAASTVGPIRNPANGHDYYYYFVPSFWTEAEQAAVARGGHLVKIDDAAENAWVNATFVEPLQRSLWIGLSDQAVEGQFRWSDGTTPGYTNWAASEPNNSGGVEDYAVMVPGGQWNDRAGNVPAIFALIEIVPPPVCAVDVNLNGHPDVGDIFAFLALWFRGCP